MKIIKGYAFFSFFIIVCLALSLGDEGHGNHDEAEGKSSSLWKRLVGAYSIYRSAFPTSASKWDKVKMLVNQAQTYFFPPNIDFRGRDSEAEAGRDGGAGEKVKEAVAKSLGKSKATVEDSAKSAAKIAGETVHKTKEKVKKSLSQRNIGSEEEL